MESGSKKVIFIIGPTGSGKSELSYEVCRSVVGGEMVNCDSIQIYRGHFLGSAKPSQRETLLFPHHLFGFQNITEPYSLHKYINRAIHTIEEIHARGGTPILVGGTMLYVHSLLIPGVAELAQQTSDDEQCEPPSFEGIGNEELHKRLTEIDPQRAATLHVNDRRRIIRSLEVQKETGNTHSKLMDQFWSTMGNKPFRYDPLVLWVDREKEDLKLRIAGRAQTMLDEGLIYEILEMREVLKKSPQPRTSGIYQSIAYSAFEPLCDALPADPGPRRDMVEAVCAGWKYKEVLERFGVTGDLGDRLYFLGNLMEKNDSRFENEKKSFLRIADLAKERMITKTSQYIKRQNLWIKNKFLIKQPNLPIIRLPPLQLSKATSIVNSFLEGSLGFVNDHPLAAWRNLNETDQLKRAQSIELNGNQRGTFICREINSTDTQTFRCPECNVVAKGVKGFETHLKSRRHKKRKKKSY